MLLAKKSHFITFDDLLLTSDAACDTATVDAVGNADGGDVDLNCIRTQPHLIPHNRSASLSAQTSSRAAASTGFFHRSIGVRCVGICVQLKTWVVS